MADPGPGFQEIARGLYLEALLIDEDRVWYGDVTLGGIRELGTERVLLPGRHMIGGLLRNRDGKLLVSGVDGIAWVDPDSGASGMLVEGLCGVNEMRGDGRGGIWFGTIDLAAILLGKRPGPSSIYHLAPGGTPRQLATGLSFANGLTPRSDGKTLFFNESFTGTCAFPILSDGSLGEPLWKLANSDCDGMALDQAGNLWVTGFYSSDLVCLGPDGSEQQRLPLPGLACTNVRFGGSDLCDLYVTMVDTAAAQLLAEGKPLTQQSSVLYRGRSVVPGQAFAESEFEL
jgi:sugar lactone lactonase YvrE